MMAARKPKDKAPASAAKSLQTALAFCSVAYKEIGAPYQCHVILHSKFLHAFDGVIAAGHPIDDDLTICPHGARLRDAISRPGAGLRLAVAPDGAHLAVSVAGFRARVPCIPLQDVQPFGPDPVALAVAGDVLQLAFGAVAHLAANSGTTVLESSLLLEPNTLTATNRIVVIQHWHGLPLPRAFVIPRAFATAVLKCALTPVGIGWGAGTFTVHYDNGAWLRTQLYAEEWPDLMPVFGAMNYADLKPLPESFFAACEALQPFIADDARLIVGVGCVYTRGNTAECDCKELDPGKPLELPAKHVKHLTGRVNAVEWHNSDRAVYFAGDNIRAAIQRHEITVDTAVSHPITEEVQQAAE